MLRRLRLRRVVVEMEGSGGRDGGEGAAAFKIIQTQGLGLTHKFSN